MILLIIILLIISMWKWFIYNMSTKGLLLYIGEKFGEDKIPDGDDLEEIISKAIKFTLKISSRY